MNWRDQIDGNGRSDIGIYYSVQTEFYCPSGRGKSSARRTINRPESKGAMAAIEECPLFCSLTLLLSPFTIDSKTGFSLPVFHRHVYDKKTKKIRDLISKGRQDISRYVVRQTTLSNFLSNFDPIIRSNVWVSFFTHDASKHMNDSFVKSKWLRNDSRIFRHCFLSMQPMHDK